MSIVIVLVAALIATVTDVRSGKIPNVLVVAFLLAALTVHAVEGPASLLGALGAGLVAFVIGLGVFALRLTGGGDVKFFAAAFVALGSAQGLHFLAYTLISGGVLAIVVSASRGSLRTMLANVHASAVTLTAPASSGRMPYAPAMLAGAVTLLAANTVLPALRFPI